MADEKHQIEIVINPEGMESTQTQLRTMEKFIQQTEKRAKILDKIKICPVVRIKDEITGPVAKIESRLKALNSKTITVAINAQDMIGNVGFGGRVKKYAWGGVVTGPHLGVVGEAGPEAIIPLSPPMRSRAIDLWQQTGNMLGVPMHDEGGIVGRFLARAGSYIKAVPDIVKEKFNVSSIASGIMAGADAELAAGYSTDAEIATTYNPASGVGNGIYNYMANRGAIANGLAGTGLVTDIISERAEDGLSRGILLEMGKGSGYLAKHVKGLGEVFSIFMAEDKTKAVLMSASGLAAGALFGFLFPAGAAAVIVGLIVSEIVKWGMGRFYEYENNRASKMTYEEAMQLADWENHATGGILTRPHLGMVAEAGPEAIIPLSSRLRGRALDLWEEAGRYLGVRPYAIGGFAGPLPAYVGAGNGGYGDIKVTSVNNLQVGSEIDVGTLALQIGNNIARDIKQALQNRS